MLKLSRNFIGFFIVSFFLFLPLVQARENVTDWYVKDLREEFVLSSDSTMIVTEWITADCGQAVGKHGIFRVVPTETRIESGGSIKTPVVLLGITDFQGNPYAFETTENNSDKTLTWKIGDPNTTVTGEHQYKIVYEVKNVIRFSQQFDEFYWNVGGNFWTMDIDAFRATVIFPETIQKDAVNLSFYTGAVGSKDSGLIHSSWQDARTLSLIANQPLTPGEGVTLSASVPKNIFVPYQFSFLELYGQYFWIFLPLFSFVFCYRIWRKYGDDPTWNKVVIPEYEIPEHLDVLELGMLSTNGKLKDEFVTAAIIELAVKGALKIREQDNKILFFTSKEFILEKQSTEGISFSSHQRILFDKLFESGNEVSLPSLKNKFYQVLSGLTKEVINSLTAKGLIDKRGLPYQVGFIAAGVLLFFISIFLLVWTASLFVFLLVFMSAILFIFFGMIMPKRTEKGTEVNWKISGLKLYMNVAEKYRQQFYEKENIFETLLPCAIAFDMTKEWVKKMKDIYGEAYFSQYHPAWFVSSSMSDFNVESFTSSLETLSSSIASNTGSPSGSGGSGSSGGGSGGGGGGGW